MNHVSVSVTVTLPDNNVYVGCGVSKSCFGLPDGCIATMNCVSFGAVIVKDQTFQFEMKSSSKLVGRKVASVILVYDGNVFNIFQTKLVSLLWHFRAMQGWAKIQRLNA